MRYLLKATVALHLIMVGEGAAWAATPLAYQYDADGNLISGEGKYYEYNDANQLVRVRHKNAGGPVIAEYFYDHAGQRVKKVENGLTTYYIGKHFEKRLDGETASSTKYYFAGGERVARKDGSGAMSFYHGDHLGSTNVLSNASGALVEKTKYYPFGEIREGGKERFTYTGKEKDKVTDWYYYEARYYDYGVQHFTQSDTAEVNYYDPQNLNRFAFVRNNPIKLIDPDGHDYVDSAVKWASNTSAGNWLGDQTLKLMGVSDVSSASPEVLNAVNVGLGHVYDVTKETAGIAVNSTLDAFTGDFKAASLGIAEMSSIFLGETKMLSADQVQKIREVTSFASDVKSLMDIKDHVKSLNKEFHSSRESYKYLVKVLGKDKYSQVRKFINTNKLHDAYTIIKDAKDVGEIHNRNFVRK